MIPRPLDADTHAALLRSLRGAPGRPATPAERAWIQERTPRGSAWDGLLALLDAGALTVCHRPELQAPALLALDRVVLATPVTGPEPIAGAFAAHLVAPPPSGRWAFARRRLDSLTEGPLLAAAPEPPSLHALARWSLADDPDRVALAALLSGLDDAPPPPAGAAGWGWLRRRIERAEPLPPELPVPTFEWRGHPIPHVHAPAPDLDPHHAVEVLARRVRSDRPLLVGVFGPAASGKSTFCRGLVQALARRGIPAVSLGGDRFLWPGPGFRYTTRGGRRVFRIRGPAIYDHAAVARALAALRQGGAVHLPADPHERSPPARIGPAPVVIVDGVYLACDPDVRALLDVILALCVPDPVRLERKWRRDAGPGSSHRRDVIRDFIEKQLLEVTDGVLPALAGPVLRVDASGPPLR